MVIMFIGIIKELNFVENIQKSKIVNYIIIKIMINVRNVNKVIWWWYNNHNVYHKTLMVVNNTQLLIPVVVV